MRHFAYIQPEFLRGTTPESAYDKRVSEHPESSMLLRTAIRQSQRASDASDRDMIVAVHGDRLSSYVGCAIGEQKTDRLDRLLRRGPTPHRNPRQYAVPELVAPDRFSHGSLDNPETHGGG